MAGLCRAPAELGRALAGLHSGLPASLPGSILRCRALPDSFRDMSGSAGLFPIYSVLFPGNVGLFPSSAGLFPSYVGLLSGYVGLRRPMSGSCRALLGSFRAMPGSLRDRRVLVFALDVDGVCSNRSLCWIRLGQADGKSYRAFKPDWPKVCYKEGAALCYYKGLMKQQMVYEGVKLDPENTELITAFREAHHDYLNQQLQAS